MQAKGIDALGFEITSTIPNQPVQHKVDLAREREFFRWLVIGAVVLAAAVFDGSQRMGKFSHGYRIEQLQQERAAEEAKSRALRLELSVLQDPKRIEDIATKQLHLVAPGRLDAVVIERLVPPPQPPSSIVALR